MPNFLYFLDKGTFELVFTFPSIIFVFIILWIFYCYVRKLYLRRHWRLLAIKLGMGRDDTVIYEASSNIKVMSKRNSKKAFIYFKRITQKTTNESVKLGGITALLLLVKQDPNEVENILLALLDDYSAKVRMKVVTALGEFPTQSVVDSLRKRLNIEQEPNVKLAIFQSIKSILYILIESNFKDENYDKTEVLLRELLSLDSTDKRASELLKTLPTMRNMKEERESQEKIKKLYKEASEKFKSEDFDKTEEILKQLLTMDPNTKKVEEMLAKLPVMRQQKLEREKVIAETKRQEEIKKLRNKVISEFDGERFDDAEKILRELLVIDPNNEDTKVLLSMLPEMKQKKVEREKAIAEAKRQEKIKKLCDNANDEIKNERFNITEKNLLELLALDPSNEDAKSLLSKLPEMKHMKEERETKEEINKLYKKAGEEFRNGEFDKAEEKLKQLLSIDPNNKEAKVLLVDTLEAKKINHINKIYDSASKKFKSAEYIKAEELLRELLSLEPNHSNAYSLLMHSMEIRKRSDEFSSGKGVYTDEYGQLKSI